MLVAVTCLAQSPAELLNNPAVRVACFPARVQDGAVFVQLRD